MEIKTESGDEIEVKRDTQMVPVGPYRLEPSPFRRPSFPDQPSMWEVPDHYDEVGTGLIWLAVSEDHSTRPNDPTGGAVTTLTPAEARRLAAELLCMADLLDSKPANT